MKQKTFIYVFLLASAVITAPVKAFGVAGDDSNGASLPPVKLKDIKDHKHQLEKKLAEAERKFQEKSEPFKSNPIFGVKKSGKRFFKEPPSNNSKEFEELLRLDKKISKIKKIALPWVNDQMDLFDGRDELPAEVLIRNFISHSGPVTAVDLI